MIRKPPLFAARVVSATRRYVDVLTEQYEILRGRLGPRVPQVVVGDEVSCSKNGETLIVEELNQRKNCLSRTTYGGKRKFLAANLDLLAIVSAVSPPVNPFFIDRVLAIASKEDIQVLLIINKSDLGIDSAREHVDTYSTAGFKVLHMSALLDKRLNELEKFISAPDVKVIAFCGTSGVGKSTIINRLIPDTDIFTQALSDKSGQGKQTTTQASGYLFRPAGNSPRILIDLPGVQNIGISHLSEQDAASSFPEIAAFREKCAYKDCLHLAEQECGVKEALAEGRFSKLRYQSYLSMIEEIERAKPY